MERSGRSLGVVLGWSWAVWGSSWGSLSTPRRIQEQPRASKSNPRAPKSDPRATQEVPRSPRDPPRARHEAPRLPKTDPREPKGAKIGPRLNEIHAAFLDVFVPSWAPYGNPLGTFCSPKRHTTHPRTPPRRPHIVLRCLRTLPQTFQEPPGTLWKLKT